MDQDKLDQLLDLARGIVARARKAGADVAEAIASDSVDLSAKVRMGEPELVEQAGHRSLTLRVQRGGRTATVTTSDPSEQGVSAIVADALELAQLSEVDDLAAPPDPSLLAKDIPDLDLCDPATRNVDAKEAVARAAGGEGAARALDPRITNSEGATFSRSAGASVFVTSNGFSGGYRSSYQSLSVSPVADDADGKKRSASHWDGRRFLADLAREDEIGREAARRTVAQLGTRKVPSAEVPVVFDPDAGRALLSLLYACLEGGSIYRRASYLCDRIGDQIGSELIQIADDPLIPRAPGSRPFDGEGLPARRNALIENGRLRSYLLDTYSARKLGLESTGSASRARPGVSPSNFHLLPGGTSPEAIVAEVEKGLYVTSMMGFGFNAVTGDFSRGAEGFWIENGEKTFPVGEITVSLNFNELWKRVDAVGSDLDPKTTFAAPTFRVRQMTVAGS